MVSRNNLLPRENRLCRAAVKYSTHLIRSIDSLACCSLLLSINQSRCLYTATTKHAGVYCRLRMIAVAIISEIAAISSRNTYTQRGHLRACAAFARTHARTRAQTRIQSRENPLFPSRSRQLFPIVRFLTQGRAGRLRCAPHRRFTEISDVGVRVATRLRVHPSVYPQRQKERSTRPCELNGLKDSGAHTRCSSFRE